ncbi:MAG: phosphoribosylformylglycinamidine synthase subunit PurS [Pseudomonadota bacterium]
MPDFSARLIVTLKNGVLDPQGKASLSALHSLGFAGVESVRQGKVMDVELIAGSESEAQSELSAMCEKLLANTVIEDFEIEWVREQVPA